MQCQMLVYYCFTLAFKSILMKHFLATVILFITVNGLLKGQSPGGIATNNTMWLRSDNGISSTGSTVTQWQELSGSNITGNFTVQPIAGTVTAQTGPALINAGINFNPYISFDGSTNSLSSINSFFGTSLVTNSNVSIFQVINLKGGIVWLKWETDQVGSTGRFGFENAAGNIRFDFPKAVPVTAGQNIGTINVLNKHSLSTAYADAATSVNRLNGADNTSIPIPAPGNFGGVSAKIVIGNEYLLNLPCQVDMAEVIIYARTLSAAERNKIESYLAVKYGFTLNQLAVNANNYTASNNVVTWDRALNSSYANDITGIGRDDASALSQKQSKSINSTAFVTLYNGTYVAGNFPLENSTNTNNFFNDLSYLLVGDNGGTTTIDQCAFDSTAQRMQRVWKASSTGTVFPLTVSVDQASVPAVVKNIMVSADPAFPRATTAIYPLTIANGKLYSSVTLNHNDYFTFATDTLLVTMAVTQPVCSNPNSGNVITTVTGGNPPLSYLWTPSGQVTANLVNVAGGTYTLTITQGTCKSMQQVVLTAPVAPAAPLANAVTVCPGNTATLTVQNPQAGYTYNWYDVLTGGTSLATGISFTTPAVSTATTWYVEAINGSCTSVRSPVLVSVNNVGAPVVNGAAVCQGNTATLTVQNPNAGDTYNWYNIATGGTSLGTGISFTTPVITTNTTYYVEAVNSGCSSTRTGVAVTVTTVTVPVAAAVTACQGNTATLTVQNQQAGYTYNWYDVLTGGTSLGTGISFTTIPITTNTTYYVEAITGGCNGVRVPVSVSSYAPLITPVVTAATITASTVTFSWQMVAGATGYEVSVNGGPYITPSSGSTGTTHLVSGLTPAVTVTIDVVALSAVPGCPNSAAGNAVAKTELGGFYVPTAFTPNGDPYNEVMRPILPTSATLEYFIIYNRWGQKVFTTSIIGQGWNGKWKGKEQPAGVFVWICRYQYMRSIFDEKGSFILLH